MKIADTNWFMVERYLERDDRAVIPLGSTEQHAYLSNSVDSILAERVALEGAAPSDALVFPVLAFGITPYFAAYPGSITLRMETYARIITDMLDGGMEPFRRMQYRYYREGLDVMAENAERGRAGITAAMELLQKARENKSMSMLPELFTEYKRDELVGIYNKEKANAQERLTVSEILSRINPSQNSYWRKMK